VCGDEDEKGLETHVLSRAKAVGTSEDYAAVQIRPQSRGLATGSIIN
jgi:hypothetical protein